MRTPALQKLIDNNVAVDREQLDCIIAHGIDVTNVNTSEITDMSELFFNSYRINGAVTNWDVSNVEYMQHMFEGSENFNQPLNWDTSSVIDMSYMFKDADSFNQPLRGSIRRYEGLGSGLFKSHALYTQTKNWDTSDVRSMRCMFFGATSFNQPLNWDVRQVVDIFGMFCEAKNFDRHLIWKTQSVLYDEDIFYGSNGTMSFR